ncbi:MAG: sigma-54 dependent transcriptional regulator [Proteobacteria bacterium]|nr:sigma-54 dependent transcriptional regulator [Pseudomonadota bacterium]MBU1717347.1 sigma-54 dependent transcriptional regulator [Pseudomonadota bacterium]
MSKRILIIDDEKSILDSLAGILSDEGFEPLCAESAERGLAMVEEEQVDLVLLDIWMPGMDGLQALEKIKEGHPLLPVIMISGHGNIETAVKATKMGAFDFIEKPPSYDKIVVAVNNGLHMSELEEENLIFKNKEGRKPSLVGNSEAIVRLKEQIEMVAPTEAWVLITGEHGTGKEVVAQTIHRLSQVSSKPMVEVNCAAIPEELIESELFGHEKGAFTGATASKRGKFDQADGGMLFLDEIGDMSLKTQAKILRILQEQNFERVGGAKTISVKVRVLAATNKNLEEEIEKGNFRADLFWRLNVVPLEVPPLRDRADDIPCLIDEFLQELSRKGFSKKKFDDESVKVLMGHTWPGNVRELRNLVERISIMTAMPEIDKKTVTMLLKASPGMEKITFDDTWSLPYRVKQFKEAKKNFEREFLRTRLRENEGNIAKTAEEIGLERSHLHKKMKSLDVDNE